MTLTEAEPPILSQTTLAEHLKSHTVEKRRDVYLKIRTFTLTTEALVEHNRSWPKTVGTKRSRVCYEYQNNNHKRQCLISSADVSGDDCGESCMGCHVCHQIKLVEDEDSFQEVRVANRPTNHTRALNVHVPADNSVHLADRRNAEVS